MEINGSPFAWGDQIYERATDFTSEVSRLVNCLEKETRWVNLRVIQDYQRRWEIMNVYIYIMKMKLSVNYNEFMWFNKRQTSLLCLKAKNDDVLNGPLSFWIQTYEPVWLLGNSCQFPSLLRPLFSQCSSGYYHWYYGTPGPWVWPCHDFPILYLCLALLAPPFRWDFFSGVFSSCWDLTPSSPYISEIQKLWLMKNIM